MAEVSLAVSAAGATTASRGRHVRATPASLRLALIIAAVASAGAAWFLTLAEPLANPDLELVRVLQFMTAAKVLIGAAALWMVSIRFRYPITARQAVGYIAGAAIMASGPGAMWSTAHIILGSLLFYGGLLVLVAVGWMDGRRRWRLGGRAV